MIRLRLWPDTDDGAHDLVARHDMREVNGQVAFDDVQVRSADGAGIDREENFPDTGSRRRFLDHLQGFAIDRSGSLYTPGFHPCSLDRSSPSGLGP
ncbi:MAG: hypothetical protein ACJA07_000936 [Rhodococcus sp. (in: high G+C Gram-positive bacteria)]|jgi:hypothetical protein